MSNEDILAADECPYTSCIESARHAGFHTADTYAFCPDCGYRLQECSDDEDEDNYYECFGCGAELDLDGFPKKS